MSYDYILYDNRTLGPGGYDWAVKAATGQLRDDPATRQRFVAYCKHSFDTRLGPLSNFGAALGGISLKGGRYLLCVTLENEDLHQRRSCAFVGIHCLDPAALKILLTQGNPLLSAEKVSNGAPHEFILTGNGPVTTGSSRRAGCYPFHRGSSSGEAAEILLQRIQKGAKLPSILGITHSKANRTQLLRNYEFAYCLGVPETAELHPTGPGSDKSLRSGIFKKASSWLLLGAAICVAVWAFAFWGYPFLMRIKQDNNIPIEGISEVLPTPHQSVTSSNRYQSADLVRLTPEAFLKQFETLLQRIESATPQKLMTTSEWKTLNEVRVVPKHEQDREKMIALLKTDLPRFQDAVKAENFSYFFQAGPVQAMSPIQRVNEIRKKTGRIEAPTDGCALIHKAFARWTNPQDSPTGEWCGMVEDFAKEIRESNSAH